MIEYETILTVFGILLLAFSYWLSIAYVSKKEAGNTLMGKYLPFALNLSVFIYIGYGLFEVPKLTTSIKTSILIALMVLMLIEVSYMYQKPSTWFGISSAWIVVNVATILRLYLIVSLNCDFAKTMVVSWAKKVVEPGKYAVEAKQEAKQESKQEVKQEAKLEPNWNKAYDIFDAALRKKDQFTPEERLELINKYRAAWGKGPKESVVKGGR